jgi:transaldolase
MYVEELIAPGVVNTMPEATIHAFADHGEMRGDTITGRYDEAQQVLNDLAAIGVEYKDVVDTLEREGVEKFSQSWGELGGSVSEQLSSTAGGRQTPENAR